MKDLSQKSLTKMRNNMLVQRFNYWSNTKRLRLDDALKVLLNVNSSFPRKQYCGF